MTRQAERAAAGGREPRGPAFLPTKLGAPRLPPGFVRRIRLTETLAVSRPSLLLIIAPPGFGKTSLLADWADVDSRRFAWVTIDVQDNDQAVLWQYIGAALGRTVDGGRRSSSFAGLAREADPAARAAAEIDADDEELVLVFDDYHLLESDDCHDTVMRFVELSPANVQVAVSTRADPPLPVARLRATGGLLELRARDLQFAPDESEELLNRSLRLSLDPGAIDILHERTEGWPAGLYLAYLSMRANADRRAFVETFGASNRHVIDYLTEQVLMALDPDTLRFMLATSIVDTISGPLADAITGESGSAPRLIELERANVFISPLDDRREWYRYHHLLRELLSIELDRRHPDRVPLLHQQAAVWFAENRLPDRAVRHAIAAGDLDLAARVISENYLNLLELGRTATLLGWLEQMPPDAIEADRRLGVVKAWTMHFLGRHDEGNAALAVAIAAPAATGPQPDGASSIDATAALIGAAFPGDDAGRMLASARRAFDLEGGRESPWRTTVHVLLGFALARCGRWDEAREPLRVGAELAMAAGMWMDAVGARSLLAWVELETGDPATAEHFARAAIDLGDANGLGPTATYAYARTILGLVLVRRGEAEGADAELSEALPVMRALGEPLGVAETLLPLSQARRMLGRRDEASLLLREAGAIIDGMRDPGILRETRRIVASARAPRFSDQVSQRELEVLQAMAAGSSKREAADKLFVSYNTVHSHVRSIYQKLDAHSLPEAVAKARRLGLIE
ncbi:MAG TPA: LuxR C-terminal-related transcriptional regulator [Candidatus Limnocylindrales bacterium]|nr:LuxR C-terminal-related transcriptional regulator [Candidatus Limnocylindrales bacterium]